VSVIVLGAQRLAEAPGEERALALQRAIASGCTWVDAADVYGRAPGDAERWLAGAPVRVATKGGLVRDGAQWRPDGRAQALVAAAEASRERLQVEALDLWSWHAPDPRVPLKTSLGGVRRVLDRGIARAVGLANTSVGALRAALDAFPVAAVQVELSPLRPAAFRSGVIEEALRRGIPVWVYRPFGGRPGRVLGHARVRAAAGDAPAAAVVLAWLQELGLTPIPGPTTAEHVAECFAPVSLTAEARAALDAFEPGLLRVPRASRAPPVDASGEVVVIMGPPGSGKSTRVARYPSHLRLNRDERGGKLTDLIRPLEEALQSGIREVVLDNTYASRASRSEVIEAAWRHGVPARCEWLQTSADDAEVNVVSRILDRVGHLPDELDRPDLGVIPPRALHRFREDLETPEVGEGFTRVDLVPFVRVPSPGAARALLLDPRDLTAEERPRIEALLAEGYTPAVLGWGPPGDRASVEAIVRERGWTGWIGWCPHPPGPPRCWCRKPLPGLGVWALRALGASAPASLAVGSSPADRSLARKLGVSLVDTRS
jgi:aryl-alcohol dehydrogenase-like predicted oxidoreductase